MEFFKASVGLVKLIIPPLALILISLTQAQQRASPQQLLETVRLYAAQNPDPVPVQEKTATTLRKWVNIPNDPEGGVFAHFTPRDKMRATRALMPKANAANIPNVVLPVDWTNGQKVNCPMYDNDRLGNCGEVMCMHADQILTYGRGMAPWSQSVFDVRLADAQYLKISRGDNGMNEDMVVGTNGCWRVGLAGMGGSWPNSRAVIYKTLDLDMTNPKLIQFCLDNFGTVQMGWSVPDDFLNNFTPGKLYDAPAIPNDQNGHYTPLSDVSAAGNYTCWTWANHVYQTQGFVSAVHPDGFVAFGARQFDPATGKDWRGHHIRDVNKLWVGVLGGESLPESVMAAFPPSTPPPTPVATTITLSTDLKAGTYTIQEKKP